MKTASSRRLVPGGSRAALPTTGGSHWRRSPTPTSARSTTAEYASLVARRANDDIVHAAAQYWPFRSFRHSRAMARPTTPDAVTGV